MASPVTLAAHHYPRALAHPLAALALALLAGGCLAGCASTAAPCLPAPMTATPDQVTAGGRVTVSSPAATCPTPYPGGTRYGLRLTLPSRGEPLELGSTTVSADGSFTATLTVPAAAPPGPAAVEVIGSSYDRCGESASAEKGTGAGDNPASAGSCAVYAAPLTVTGPG